MSKKIHIMIGSGIHSIFTNVKKGTRIMINSGDHSTFTTAGKHSYFPRINVISNGKNIFSNETVEEKIEQDKYLKFEEEQEKNASFVKKLQRQFKKR